MLSKSHFPNTWQCKKSLPYLNCRWILHWLDSTSASSFPASTQRRENSVPSLDILLYIHVSLCHDFGCNRVNSLHCSWDCAVFFNLWWKYCSQQCVSCCLLWVKVFSASLAAVQVSWLELPKQLGWHKPGRMISTSYEDIQCYPQC